MKYFLIAFFMLLSLSGFSQTDDEDDDYVEPPMLHGVRMSASTPHPWFVFNPAINIGSTFEKKKNFFFAGP